MEYTSSLFSSREREGKNFLKKNRLGFLLFYIYIYIERERERERKRERDLKK